ncbi:MAG: hypothetical protein AAGI11_00475 [Pseudomonadota bacterium]
MSDSDKSKQELLDELEALRAKLDGRSSDDTGDGADSPEAGVKRRDILTSAWVAPVILSVPLGTAVSPRKVHAQYGTTPFTTPQTAFPTSPPTSAPTNPPTSAPTVAIPTAFPSVVGSASDVIPVEISDFDIK